jgi:hypothetical protein
MGAGLNLIQNTAGGISTGDETYQAIISDPAGLGAVANELDAVIEFCDILTKTDRIENHVNSHLDKSVLFFTGLKRNREETDEGFINRVFSLTWRKGDVVWGTKANIQHVVESCFPAATVYIAENTSDTNLLLNGDFEDVLGAEWIVSNSLRTKESRFSKSFGLEMAGAATAAQNVSLLAGSYFLHFFMQGEVSVQNTGLNLYWNMNTGAWQATKTVWLFTTVLWEAKDVFFILPNPGSINILFESSAALLDYLRLYKKPKHSTFSVMVVFSAEAKGQELFATQGTTDPIAGIIYKNMSYFDSDFLTGPAGASQNTYTAMLEDVKAIGVKGFLEFIERSY